MKIISKCWEKGITLEKEVTRDVRGLGMFGSYPNDEVRCALIKNPI